MIVSALRVGLRGSKITRLLRQGMEGHIVEMVGLSWMAKPWGRSSRNRRISQPPGLGVWLTAGETASAISIAKQPARRSRARVTRRTFSREAVGTASVVDDLRLEPRTRAPSYHLPGSVGLGWLGHAGPGSPPERSRSGQRSRIVTAAGKSSGVLF